MTLGLFLCSLAGHWDFGWFAFVEEQSSHGQAPQIGAFTVEMMRDTLENWQSEFLQFLWQVGGLAYFLYLGWPKPKVGDDRIVAEIEEILCKVDPVGGERTIREIDDVYRGRHTDHPL